MTNKAQLFGLKNYAFCEQRVILHTDNIMRGYVNVMRNICKIGFVLLFSAVLLVGDLSKSHAQTEGSVLFVAPYRVVITPDEKVAVINVANQSAETRRYDLTLVDQVMNETGMTQRVDTFDYSVKRMVRFVPKRFTLKPGERQTIRVLAQRPADLEDGDYHSHLLFREVPLNLRDKESLKQERAEAEQSVSFEIRTLYGVAVPIIVQQGAISSSVILENASLSTPADGTTKNLVLDLKRKGNAEASAKVNVSYVADGAESVSIIDPQWIRMYREVDTIRKTLPLTKMPEGAQGGKLVISILKNPEDPSSAVTREINYQ